MIFLTPGINNTSEPSKKLPNTIKGAMNKSFITGSISQFLTANVKPTITNG